MIIRKKPLLVSALSFFCLNCNGKTTSVVAVLIGFTAVAFAVVKSENDPCGDTLRKSGSLLSDAFYILSAIGICTGCADSFYYYMSRMEQFGIPAGGYGGFKTVIAAACIFAAALSVYFVYVCLRIFRDRIMAQVDGDLFHISQAEKIIYAVIFIIGCVYITASFTKSCAFYNTDAFNVNFDVIYTGDSNILMRPNSFLWLCHPENDLRQPLFALFSAPFMGLPYLIGRPFSFTVRAIIMDITQFGILLISFFLLARILKLKTLCRISFMIFACSTYTCLLFTVMMEQYIIAFFWLVFMICQITMERETDRLVFTAAGGTLLTGILLLPFVIKVNLLKKPGEWIGTCGKFLCCFAGMLVAFCRYDVILNVFSQASYLSGFAGGKVPVQNRFMQFTWYIKNCFTAPNAGADHVYYADHSAWLLRPVTAYSAAGIMILVLSITSGIINRKKKITKIAVFWVGVSIIILAVMGWGTIENGLIIYSLYFGWAFFVLLFQLIQNIAEITGITGMVPAVTAISCTAMLIVNIPAVSEMVEFASLYYPA